MRCYRTAFVVALSVAALAVMPVAPTSARAETAQAAPSDNAKPATTGVASVDPANSPEKGLAGKAIDRLTDTSAPPAEQAERKRRLLKGPPEFRDMRADLPKAKPR